MLSAEFEKTVAELRDLVTRFKVIEAAKDGTISKDAYVKLGHDIDAKILEISLLDATNLEDAAVLTMIGHDAFTCAVLAPTPELRARWHAVGSRMIQGVVRRLGQDADVPLEEYSWYPFDGKTGPSLKPH